MAAKGLAATVDQMKYLGEQRSCDGDLRHLESDVAAMTHDLGTDLDELLAQRSAANALLPPIRLTSALGQNRKSSMSLGMSAVGGKAEVDFGRPHVCS